MFLLLVFSFSMFFDSAVKILEEVKRHLNLNVDMDIGDGDDHKTMDVGDGDDHKAAASAEASSSSDRIGTSTPRKEEEAWRGAGTGKGGSPQYIHESSIPQHHMFCMTMALPPDHHPPSSSSSAAAASGARRKTSFQLSGNHNNNHSHNGHNHSSSSVTVNGSGTGGYAPLYTQGDDFEDNHNHKNNRHGGLLDQALQSLLLPTKPSSAAAAASSSTPIPISTAGAGGGGGGGASMPSVYSMSGDEVDTCDPGP